MALSANVLEGHENAVAWLREPSDTFCARTPLELVTTDIGAEKVTNMLYQMECGISAVVVEEWNYVLDPQHPDFKKLAFQKPKRFQFDRRLARER